MDLHQLECVRMVVRTGSVTRAAEELHVSQPSVSKQIRLLERELGAALFHRVGRRVVPAEAGMLLAECADRVFHDLTATADVLAQLASAQRGSLRLCATETVTDNLLPPVLAELRRLRPGLHLTIEMVGTDEAIAQVLADTVDLALVVLPIADSRLDIHPLFEEAILLAVPARHPWAARGTAPLAEALADPDLLLSMPGHGLRAQIEREAQALGLRLESRLDLRSQRALLNLVACGAGIAFAPLASLREPDPRIATLRLAPGLTRRIGWIIRRGRRLPPAGTLLLELLNSSRTQEPSSVPARKRRAVDAKSPDGSMPYR
jgi:DNA-binding transcriptional LysR family regulator